jgi:hypothetical protein
MSRPSVLPGEECGEKWLYPERYSGMSHALSSGIGLATTAEAFMDKPFEPERRTVDNPS